MSIPSIRDKLEILADAAKYDASCASSGTSKRSSKGGKGGDKPAAGADTSATF